jgi:hypothetical protein
LVARAFSPGLQAARSVRAEFTRLHPRPAAPLESAAEKRSGLLCHYFEGEWEILPDFQTLVPVRITTVDSVAIPAFAREENIGMVLSGYVEVARTGLYTFHLWSDDGSALYLGQEQVIDNDGLHGRAAETVDLALSQGHHRIRLDFFQRLGGIAFELWWEGPDLPLQPVPAVALNHVPGHH